MFLDRVFTPLLADHQGLKVVMEHITTADAASFVAAQDARVAATITPHHLMINRTSIFQGGIRPHLYCLPIAKRESHRQALRQAATGGSPKFFLGTDTAPHTASLKEAACGCAGCFVGPVALQCYTQVFDEENALDRLEGFASLHGPAFYGLPVNNGSVTLRRRPGLAPDDVTVGDERVVVFRGGEELAWEIA